MFLFIRNIHFFRSYEKLKKLKIEHEIRILKIYTIMPLMIDDKICFCKFDFGTSINPSLDS